MCVAFQPQERAANHSSMLFSLLLWFVSLPCLQFLQLKKGSHILVLLDVKRAGEAQILPNLVPGAFLRRAGVGESIGSINYIEDIYMATRRYISIRVLKNISRVSAAYANLERNKPSIK